MCADSIIRRLAGTFIILSVLLAALVHPAFCAFTAFVGLNLLQSSFTNFCPLERVLGRFGFAGCQPRNAT